MFWLTVPSLCSHVLVCGSITHAVAKRFLEEFYEEIPTGGPDTKFVIFLHT